MLRRLFACLVLMFPLPSLAQESVFSDYDAYFRFVDSHIMVRDFVPLIERLGGQGEYSPAELTALDLKLMDAMPQEFSNSAVLQRSNLANGFYQEARVYWNDRLSYTYFYALLHEYQGHVIVLRFSINTNVDAILGKF